jgi:dolichyl-phosphate beta-glucosyltransferase
MTRQKELSIVVPVYNEKRRIKKGLTKILKFLNIQNFTWELIVVDDGSSDNTLGLAKQILKNTKNAKVLVSRHLGKGGAIKKGVLKAKGRWVVFLEIDLATPMAELERFMPFRKEYDIIIGSRKMEGAQIVVRQSKFREFGGKVFTWLTNLLITSDISDITCGFKLFRTSVAKKLFKQSQLNDWSFDAEVLFLAQKQGLNIKELPVRWRNDPDTKVNLFRDTTESLLGLLKIRLNHALGKYDLS